MIWSTMSTMGKPGKKSTSPRRKRSSRSSSRTSNLELAAKQILQAHKVEPFVQEYKFHPIRRWRFDFAWPEKKLALEVEGGIFRGGRHTSPKGFINDCEKYNTAALMGWTVIRVTSPQIKSGELLQWIQQGLSSGGSLLTWHDKRPT